MNRANRTIKRKEEPEVETISPHFRYFSLVKFLCLWYTVQTTGQCLLPADDEKTHACHDMENIPHMKTLYIFLTRSGTLLSNLVYRLTGAQYTHVSLAFDEDLSTLYSSTRKNGYTMFPAGPSREYLNRGVFLQRENIPCALYALEVSEEAYARARRRAEHMMNHGHLYRFNSLGLLLCWLHIRWQRRRHYFCSQFVSEVLEKSGAVDLPKDSTLMHPSDYTTLPGLECLYTGPLRELPQRQQMELGEAESVVGVYIGLALGMAKSQVRRVRRWL